MALDKFFLTLFVMEILIKWYQDFDSFWRVGWNVFDFAIVAASLLGPSKLVHWRDVTKYMLYISGLLSKEEDGFQLVYRARPSYAAAIMLFQHTQGERPKVPVCAGNRMIAAA